MKIKVSIFLTLLLLSLASCKTSQENSKSSQNTKSLQSGYYRKQWNNWAKEDHKSESSAEISAAALKFFIKSHHKTLTEKQRTDLEAIVSLTQSGSIYEIDVSVSTFLANYPILLNVAITKASETFTVMKYMDRKDRKAYLLKHCTSNVKDLIAGLPDKDINSELILVALLYPIAGGEKSATKEDKEMLRTYLSGNLSLKCPPKSPSHTNTKRG